MLKPVSDVQKQQIYTRNDHLDSFKICVHNEVAEQP